MFGKKTCKITVRAWISRETCQTNLMVMPVVGILVLLCFIASRILCGAPYRMMLELGINDLIPPVWLFTLLQSIAFFTAGCAGGFVLGFRPAYCAAEKYKSGMFFILTVAVELCWYPLLFTGGMVFAALLQSLIAFALAVFTTTCMFRVSRFAGWIFLFHSVWAFYLFILSFRIFLRN